MSLMTRNFINFKLLPVCTFETKQILKIVEIPKHFVFKVCFVDDFEYLIYLFILLQVDLKVRLF